MKQIVSLIITLIIVCNIFSQNNALTLNDAVVVNITGGAVLSINQQRPSGIALSGTQNGIIQSENENNRVAWHINDGLGSYVIPFGVAATSSQIPMIYEITAAGNNLGTLIASTYSTAADNTAFPSVGPVVTHFNFCTPSNDCSNKSLLAVDRYWIIRKNNWLTEPKSNISFSYRTEEIESPNTITETNLHAYWWSGNDYKWYPNLDPAQFLGSCNINDNIVTNANASDGNFYTWTLVDYVETTLPVEISELKTSCSINSKPVVEWTSETETNNDYYSICRSTDGYTWTNIAKIQGQGNSNSHINYEYVDNEAAENYNYYKLLQHDFDGTSTEIGIVSSSCSNLSPMNFEISISQNEQDINVSFYCPKSESFTITLYDAQGKLISRKTFVSEIGNNIVTLKKLQVETAVYMLNIIGNNFYNSKKIFAK